MRRGMRASCIDSVYCVLTFVAVGVSSMAGVQLQQHPSFARLQQPITAAILVLAMGAWLLFATFLYKIYSTIKAVICARLQHATLQEEEMVILMDVMDSNDGFDHYREQAMQEREETPITNPYAGAVRVLKMRNDLMVSIYLVSTGVFSSVFSLAALDARAGALFCCGVLTLAFRDFWMRCKVCPVFIEGAISKTGHYFLQGAESIVLTCVLVSACFTVCISPELPESYVAAGHDFIIHCASFTAPLLLSMSPPEHHYLVALETSMPFAALLAVVVLYIMSPLAPYVQEADGIKHGWMLFQLVPLVTPATIVCIMHCIKNGLTLCVAFSVATWTVAHIALTSDLAAHRHLAITTVSLLAVAALGGAALTYRRWTTVASHVIYHYPSRGKGHASDDSNFSTGTPDDEYGDAASE